MSNPKKSLNAWAMKAIKSALCETPKRTAAPSAREALSVVKWKPYIGPLDQHGLVVLCNIRTGRC